VTVGCGSWMGLIATISANVRCKDWECAMCKWGIPRVRICVIKMRVAIDSNVSPPTGGAGTIQLFVTEQYATKTVRLSRYNSLSLLESRYMLVTMWNCFNIAVWHVTPSLMYIFNESPSPPRVSITCQMPYQILAVLQPALSLRKKPTSPSSRYCHTTCAPCHGLSHSHYLVNVSSPFRGYTGKIRGSMRLVFATHCSYHISQLFIGWRVDRRTRALRF